MPATRSQIAELAMENVKLADLQPHPQNARKGDVDAIARSLKMHGQYRALVVSKDGFVLAGNHTYLAMMQLGLLSAAIHRLDIAHDAPQALEIMLADNRAADLGTYDGAALVALLEKTQEEQKTLAGTLYDQDDLLKLLGKRNDPPSDDPDEVPEPPEHIITRPGDLWILGEHRLLCGDACESENFTRLLGNDKVNLVLTDPPYGVTVDYGDNVPADSLELVRTLVAKVLPTLRKLSPVVLLTCGRWNMYAYPEPTWTLAWVEAAGATLGPWGFHCWQPILAYGADPYLKARMGARPDAYIGDGQQASSDAHPVAKPLKVWSWLLRRGSTKPGEIVLDPFAGSGTTLIAAAQLGRIARMMEVDPTFCDVICRRFQQVLGELPVLDSSGEAWDFTDLSGQRNDPTTT